MPSLFQRALPTWLFDSKLLLKARLGGMMGQKACGIHYPFTPLVTEVRLPEGQVLRPRRYVEGNESILNEVLTLCHWLWSKDIIRYVHAKPIWVLVIKKGHWELCPCHQFVSLILKKSKLGMKKCILAFNTWKTFVFLSNFYVSLTPKPTLINKQIKELHKYHELHVYTEKFRV